MKISKIIMKNFKYFDNLTINIPNDKKVILLVGPNGQGKSCVFDAFTNYIRPAKRGNIDSDFEYLRKDKNKEHGIEIFDENNNLIEKEWNGKPETRKFYGRTAYRFTKDITRTSITQAAGESVKNDSRSPERFNDLDQRIEDDIESTLGFYLSEVQKIGQKTDDIINKVKIPVNMSLKKIFGKSGIQLETILNPFDENKSAKIDILFAKENNNFLYKNLSAGEKEVFDIIFDFYRRVNIHIKNGIYFIDEPELHIHTSIQKKLLLELKKLCKKYNTQLWVATHSIGFIKVAHESKDGSVAIYEFSSKLAKGIKTINPSKLDWRGWQKVLKTPLDDLATLTLPKRIIYCEGAVEKPGFDEKIYNIIFGKNYPDTIFISSGGRTQPLNNSLLVSIVFKKLSSKVKISFLRDRDEENMDDAKRNEWLKDYPQGKMLKRLEIENYLFDFEVLQKINKNIKKSDYDKIIKDIKKDDLKKVKQKIKKLCEDESKTSEQFILKIARKVPNTSVYDELEEIIFN